MEMEIRCRLDLFLIYLDWEDHLQDTIQKADTTFASDHDLILLFYSEQLPSTAPFSFELMWLSLSKSITLSCGGSGDSSNYFALIGGLVG